MRRTISVISAGTLDDGHLLMPTLAGSALRADLPVRVSRVRTIDGGVVLSSRGRSDGDRTIRILTPATIEAWESLDFLTKYEPVQVLSTHDGIFLGAIESLRSSGGDIDISFLISHRAGEESGAVAVGGDASVTLRPGTGADDGYYLLTTRYPSNTTMIAGMDSADHEYAMYMRFPGLSIPRGATIVSAVISMTAYYANGASADLDVHVVDEADPVAMADGESIADRTLSAAVPWDGIPGWTPGATVTTPDFGSLIQGVVDRVDWATGNAVMVIVSGARAATSVTREVRTFDHSLATSPRLTVTYTD